MEIVIVMKTKINTLVISGGGIRAISYLGVFKKLEELQKNNTQFEINIKTLCAVSAGSLIGLLYILGYNAVEMHDEVLGLKLQNMKDIKFINFISKYGLDSGANLISALEGLIIKKGFNKNVTFLELYNKTGIDFQVMATNLNKYCFTRFNFLNTPEVLVTDAIRMSISIPFIFTINKYQNDIHVDGGLIDNFPIKLFEDCLDNVLGIKLVSHGELTSHIVNEKIDDIESYIYHALSCYMIQKEKQTTMSEKYQAHTIFIHTENITQTVNFSLSPNDKKKLIDIGYRAADNYFKYAPIQSVPINIPVKNNESKDNDDNLNIKTV
jgi:NTE family protein